MMDMGREYVQFAKDVREFLSKPRDEGLGDGVKHEEILRKLEKLIEEDGGHRDRGGRRTKACGKESGTGENPAKRDSTARFLSFLINCVIGVFFWLKHFLGTSLAVFNGFLIGLLTGVLATIGLIAVSLRIVLSNGLAVVIALAMLGVAIKKAWVDFRGLT